MISVVWASGGRVSAARAKAVGSQACGLMLKLPPLLVLFRTLGAAETAGLGSSLGAGEGRTVGEVAEGLRSPRRGQLRYSHLRVASVAPKCDKHGECQMHKCRRWVCARAGGQRRRAVGLTS
jgi:hypothetical protein